MDEAFDGLPTEPTLAREAAPFDHDSSFSVSSNDGNDSGEREQFVPTNRLGSDPDNYAPYKADATVVPSHESREHVNLSTEQIAKRLTTTIERCHSLLTAEFIEGFSDLPEKIRKRFLKATEQLAEKVESLG